MSLWADVWLAQNAEVLPRARRLPPRGLWLVLGFAAADIILGVNVALSLIGA